MTVCVKDKLIEGEESISQQDPWSLYLYAMKSPITSQKHQKRLSSFLKYIGLPGSIEEQARLFAQRGSRDSNWAGISDSYYRPTENEILQDFLKCVDSLTIQKDETALKKQITEMEEKSKDNEYILKARLQETNAEIKTLKSQVTYALEVLKLTR